jgi:hypothetical protein
VSGPEDADLEDAAFEERVRRSREVARRGWMLAAILYLGLPWIVLVLIAGVAGRLGTQGSLAVLFGVAVALVAAVEVARRVWRGPPT